MGDDHDYEDDDGGDDEPKPRKGKRRAPAEPWGVRNAREQLDHSQHEDTQRDIAAGGHIVSSDDARQLDADQAAKDAVARAEHQRSEVATPAPADATAVRARNAEEATDEGAANLMDAVKRRATRNRRP